ncbi:DNA-3-methyladenine glycosylase [Candida viswanathii]|uniref:DNA-3-methyladenine glycosylase n=1 Tax=Candida viswanathii TaxID=5486 RepID=A0A367YLR6_9ASCO|nr:DNA-3-methyladenine glycosylase [Candida viswanathii]
MAPLTRSKSTKPVQETLEVATVIKKPTIQKPKLTKPKPKLTKTSLDLEDLLTHIKVPEDLALPQKYIDNHSEEFIKGIKHVLKVDPSLYPVIVHQDFTRFGSVLYDEKKQDDKDKIHTYWYSLVRSVIGQQVSGAAARAIQTRFEALFEGAIPTPGKTLEFTAEELRAVGLSNSKVKYVQSISEAFNDPNNHLTQLDFYEKSPLDEILVELCKLKGIGIWSAKMFAIFTLEEMDVFAEDDLGIARGMARYLNKRPELLKKIKADSINDEETQLLLKKRLKFFNKTDSKRTWTPIHDGYVKYAARPFEPYRTVLMMILWRLSSTNIEVLEKLDE